MLTWRIPLLELSVTLEGALLILYYGVGTNSAPGEATYSGKFQYKQNQ